MISSKAATAISHYGFRLLTQRWNRRVKAKVSQSDFYVNRVDKSLIFCIYEMQSLDLSLKFVRISTINLSKADHFCCTPIELLVAKQQRFEGRSVENWQ
jgi:hypothetical protein